MLTTKSTKKRKREITKKFVEKKSGSRVIIMSIIVPRCRFSKKGKVVHLYSSFSIWIRSKVGLSPADRKHMYTKWSMHAGTYFTDPGRMES